MRTTPFSIFCQIIALVSIVLSIYFTRRFYFIGQEDYFHLFQFDMFFILFALPVNVLLLLIYGVRAVILRERGRPMRITLIVMFFNLFFIIGCAFFVNMLANDVRLNVINKSGKDITDIRLNCCSHSESISHLDSGENKTIWLRIEVVGLNAEGEDDYCDSLVLTYHINGELFKAEAGSYGRGHKDTMILTGSKEHPFYRN